MVIGALFSSSSVMRGAVLVAMTILPAALAAAPVPVSLDYPGDEFNWPGVVAYSWTSDLTGITVFPTTVVDFTVTNTDPLPQIVDTFQIFGNCSSDSAAFAEFGLFLNGTSTSWTMVDEGPCLYHNYLNFTLPVGETRFSVKLTGDRGTAPLVYARVTFGNVPPAVPLPPSVALMFAGFGALAMTRRRRSV